MNILDILKNVSTEILIVYGLILFVLILIIFVLVLDRISNKKKLMKNKDLFNNDFINNKVTISLEEDLEEEINVPEQIITKVEETVIEPVISNEEIENIEIEVNQELVLEENISKKIEQPEEELFDFTIPKIDYIQEIKYVEEDKELERTNAQLELDKLTKELEELEKQEKEPITWTTFEQEQEESAIISLDELMKKGKELYEENEEIQYIDEGNEPINLEELKAKFEKEEESKEVEVLKIEEEIPVLETTEVPVIEVKMDNFETIEEIKTYESEFVSSPEISPVYGIRKIEEEIEFIEQDSILEFEQTANYEKLDEELKKTNEFLQMLKELEKNL